MNGGLGEFGKSGEIPRNFSVASEMQVAFPRPRSDGLGVNSICGDRVSIRSDVTDPNIAAASQRSPRARLKQGKVTKADYERAAEFLRSMGAMPAAVEIAPSHVRILTSNSSEIALSANLDDLELAAWAAKHG